MIADAIHTLSDMITSIIVIWGFKQIDKPDVADPFKKLAGDQDSGGGQDYSGVMLKTP